MVRGGGWARPNSTSMRWIGDRADPESALAWTGSGRTQAMDVAAPEGPLREARGPVLGYAFSSSPHCLEIGPARRGFSSLFRTSRRPAAHAAARQERTEENRKGETTGQRVHLERSGSSTQCYPTRSNTIQWDDPTASRDVTRTHSAGRAQGEHFWGMSGSGRWRLEWNAMRSGQDFCWSQERQLHADPTLLTSEKAHEGPGGLAARAESVSPDWAGPCNPGHRGPSGDWGFLYLPDAQGRWRWGGPVCRPMIPPWGDRSSEGLPPVGDPVPPGNKPGNSWRVERVTTTPDPFQWKSPT